MKHIGKAIKDFIDIRSANFAVFIVYGLLYNVSLNLWKPFFVKFLERLGGRELEISLLNALPGLVAAAFLLPSTAIFNRIINKKRATAAFIIISRAVLLIISFLPMMPPRTQSILFVVSIAVMGCPDSFSQTSIQGFLGSLLTGNTRVRAIALRNKFSNIANFFVTVGTGLAIMFLPATEDQRIFLYQIFLLVHSLSVYWKHLFLTD